MKLYLHLDAYDKVLLIALILAIALIPLIYLPFTGELDLLRKEAGEYYLLPRDNIYKPKLDSLLSLELIILFIVYFRLKKWGNFFVWHTSYLPLFLFLLLLVLSTIFSPYPWTAFYGRPYRWEGLLAYLAYIVLFLIISNVIDQQDKLELLLSYLFISAYLISIYGLMQFFGLDFIPRDPQRINWEKRAFATLGNPNFAGSYIALILPLSLVLYLYSRGKQEYIFGFFSSVFYAFMLSTSTRSAWLSFLLILPLYFILNFKLIRDQWFKVLLLFLIFFLITLGLDFWQEGYLYYRLISIFSDLDKLFIQIALFLALITYILQANFNISVVAVAPLFWAVLGLHLALEKILLKGIKQ